jgi:hypothetical protein
MMMEKTNLGFKCLTMLIVLAGPAFAFGQNFAPTAQQAVDAEQG